MKWPKDFLWGAATASYQVEGGIENNDWAKAAKEGRVPVCGLACDHYHHFEADFDLAKELGHNAHRLSIEWSRIEPEEGRFDDAAILHYRRVLTALRERGLEPFVTLWHWTLPDWLSETGGVERKNFPDLFARYATFVVGKLGDQATHFATMNEPYSVIINGWLRGTFPPFKKLSFLRRAEVHIRRNVPADLTKTNWFGVFDFLTLANRLALAHCLAYQAIKKQRPNTKVSLVFLVHVVRGQGFINTQIARLLNWHRTHRFLKRIVPYCDELGVNYYFYTWLGKKIQYPKTDMGWDQRPGGIRDALIEVKRYGLPIYVTEAGCADGQDAFRAQYIERTVSGIAEAMASGVDVRGFMYWSLLDNYEWAHGFTERFGLIAINYETQERTIRPSAYVYKDLILKARGLE